VPFDTCKACGLSCSDTLEDAIKLTDLFVHLRKQEIAFGPPTPGVVMDTEGPDPKLRHMTWWIPAGAKPNGTFTIQPVAK